MPSVDSEQAGNAEHAKLVNAILLATQEHPATIESSDDAYSSDIDMQPVEDGGGSEHPTKKNPSFAVCRKTRLQNSVYKSGTTTNATCCVCHERKNALFNPVISRVVGRMRKDRMANPPRLLLCNPCWLGKQCEGDAFKVQLLYAQLRTWHEYGVTQFSITKKLRPWASPRWKQIRSDDIDYDGVMTIANQISEEVRDGNTFDSLNIRIQFSRKRTWVRTAAERAKNQNGERGEG